MCESEIKGERCTGDREKLYVVWHGDNRHEVCLPCAMTMEGFCTKHYRPKDRDEEGGLYCEQCEDEIEYPPTAPAPDAFHKIHFAK